MKSIPFVAAVLALQSYALPLGADLGDSGKGTAQRRSDADIKSKMDYDKSHFEKVTARTNPPETRPNGARFNLDINPNNLHLMKFTDHTTFADPPLQSQGAENSL